MTEPVRFPAGISVYEAIRTHPGASSTLRRMGITRDYLDYPLEEAAHALRLPVEQVTQALTASEPPAESASEQATAARS